MGAKSVDPVRPQRDTLRAFEAGTCVELKNAVMRIGVHVEQGEIVSVFSKRTKREHVLVRLLRGDIAQPMGIADGGAQPADASWRRVRASKTRVTLQAEDERLRFTRTVRLLPNGMAEVKTTAEPLKGTQAVPVQFGIRAPLVPGGGGIHGHTNTSHFAHRLFIMTDAGLVEQGHRKYSNSRYEWASPFWAAFVDTVRREGLAFVFDSITPRIAVNHTWNEMLVYAWSAHQDARRGAPAEFTYRLCAFDGVNRVDRIDEKGLAAIDVPATVAPGEPVAATVTLVSFRERKAAVAIGWEGDGDTHVRRYAAPLKAYKAWHRRLTVGPFPDPIEVKYAEYVSKPALIWAAVDAARAQRFLADTPSITHAPVQSLAVSALTGRVRRNAADLVAEARRTHKAGNLPREGLAVCLVYQRFLDKQMREEAWSEETRARAFRWLAAMRATVAAGEAVGAGHIAPDEDEIKALLGDPVPAKWLRRLAKAADQPDQDVELGPTKLRQTWGGNDFFVFTNARTNAVAHAVTRKRRSRTIAKRDLLKIARNHRVYGSVMGESLFISVRTQPTLETFDIVQPHLTLDEEVDVLDYFLWCIEILFDDVNLTGSNHDSWHAAALAWLARRFHYLPDAALWNERCAAVLRHHINYQLEDGGWTEQSPSYHEMNVYSFIQGAEALRGSGFDLYAEDAGRSLLHMVRWSVAMGGREDTFSKLDDSRGGRPNIASAVLAAAAYDDGDLIDYVHRRLEAGVALTDLTAIRRFPRDLERGSADRLFVSLLTGTGHVIFRSKTADKDVRAILQYGPHGGWHGHYDKLALDVMIGGTPVLIDPGAALYEDAEHWTWHRTTRAHNTVEVDGRSQSACAGRLVVHREGKAAHLAVVEAETYPGVTHERAVLDVQGLCIVVRDQLRAAQPHDYRLHWHGAGAMDLRASVAGFAIDGKPAMTVAVPGARLTRGEAPEGVTVAPYVRTEATGRRAVFLSILVPLCRRADVTVTRSGDAVLVERGRRRVEIAIDTKSADRRLAVIARG